VSRDLDLYERELGRYRETLKLDPKLALERYGMTLINSINPAERARALKSFGMEVTDAVDFYNLGVQAGNEDNWTEAITHFRKALETDPSLVDAIYNLALCYEKTGHTPQAKSTWEIYIESIDDEDEIADIRSHVAEL